LLSIYSIISFLKEKVLHFVSLLLSGMCKETVKAVAKMMMMMMMILLIIINLLTLRRLMSYIYDISSLKVNNLTLILLTWRK
jgi:hypothetical protein